MPRFNFTFQEASPLIVYTGFWTEGNPANDSLYSDYSGSFRVTNSTDATATLNFNATGISLFGALRPNHGNYSVNLDHNAVDSASGNGNNIFKASLWEAYGLSYEPHVVDLINIPSGSGPYLDLDFVQIERQIGDDGGTIHQNTLDDTSIFVHYSTGPWQSFSESNGTTHQSISPNSQFSIAFQGCCIELYGLYANADYEVSLDGQAPVPMHGMDVTLDPSMWHPNTLLYMMDGLPQNINHTVDLNTLGSTSQDRPFYFDYAIVRSTHDFIGDSPFFATTNPSPSPPSPLPSGYSSSTPPYLVFIVVGASVGGLVLFLLLMSAVVICYQRLRSAQLALDLMEEEVDQDRVANPPTPWMLLRQRRLPPSTWQLSSVVSGWRRLSGYRTESDIASSFPESGYSLSTVSNNDQKQQRQFIIANPQHNHPGFPSTVYPPPPSDPQSSTSSHGHSFVKLQL